MLNFFKGWRRTVGCVTLVMACVFTSGWVRSRDQFDIVQFAHLGGMMSYDGILELQSFDAQLECPISWTSCRGRIPLGTMIELSLVRVPDTSPVRLPYWSIVIPLTLLSAYLLLAKPQQATPMTTSEPASAEAP